MISPRTAGFLVALSIVGSLPTSASSQDSDAAQAGADRVAALKQSLQEGKSKLQQYEWMETTIIKLKGEEKARKQNRCYYGADGKLQKTPVGGGDNAPEQQRAAGGRRGARVKEHIVENKKEDLQEYMQQAAALIHKYVPPEPARIQAAKDAGRVTMAAQGSGARMTVADYLQPGDRLTIDLDPAANRLTGLGVQSYLEKKDEPVTLAVRTATLPDGAFYAAETILTASAKNIEVVIQNSGHRPMTR